MISISYKLMLTGKVSTKGAFSLSGNVLCNTVSKTASQYTGPYEVTPNRQEQILNTRDSYLIGNIKVNPIPKNYGLITYDGSSLTVS